MDTLSLYALKAKSGGSSGEDKAFVATYGTTTAAEITAAVTAGKAIFCKYTIGGITHQLMLVDDTDSKYGFAKTTVGTSQSITSVAGMTITLAKATNTWEVFSGSDSIPTKTSDLTNDSGFVTTSDYNPDTKTSVMTQSVCKDSNGKLWTIPFARKASTFSEVQHFCRLGIVQDYVEVGQEFTVGNLASPAVVMGFIENGVSGALKIHDTSLTNGVIFQFKDCLYDLQFDAQEAFYANADGLAAGSYKFKLVEHSWYPADLDKTFYFTLTNALPAGGQIVFQQDYNATLEGASIKTYSFYSTTVIETATLSSTEISGATDLGELKNSFSGNFNSCQRALLGNNNWEQSAARQQLNSDGAAGAYLVGKNVFDRPPSWASSKAGFLNGLPTTFTNYLATMEVSTYKNTVCDGGGLYVTNDKIFLAGRNECFFPQEGADNGVAWDYYKDNSVSSVAHNAADPIRIKKLNGNARYWWQRSPNVGNAYTVRYVSAAGSSNSGYAYNSTGVAPAFCIA